MSPTDVPKLVRKKIVIETVIEEASILIFKPPIEGKVCDCKGVAAPTFICRRCYGTEIVGGFDARRERIAINEVRYEEVENSVTELNTTKDTDGFLDLDDWITVTFNCPIHCNIYYGCIFELDNRFWRVTGVESTNVEIDEDDNFVDPHLEVIARNLHAYEAAHTYLDDLRIATDELKN